jgi:DNA-binding CsgD family transcriptional regulator
MKIGVDREQLTDLIYHAALSDLGWQECVSGIGRAVAADCVGLFRHDFMSGTGDIEYADGIKSGFRSAYAEFHAQRNVWFRDHTRLIGGVVLSGTELVPVWEIVRTDFYLNWLRPQSILHALIGVITRDGAALNSLVAMRTKEKGPFEHSERALMVSIAPHLRRARALAAHLKEDRRRTSILTELFNRAPQAILVVDKACLIHMRNRAADELLAHDHGLRCMGARLCLLSPEENRQLRELVAAKADGGGASERMLVTHPLPDNAPLLLTVSPMASKIAEGGSDEIPFAAVSTRCPARCKHLTASQLRRVLHLTPAEGELAALILGGHNLVHSAAVLHISKNTARTHMKRIYSKAAIHRRPDLRRLLDLSVLESSDSPLHHPKG